MSFNKTRTRKFKKSKPQNQDLKIESFVLRNSKNGFYTRVSTISKKFEIPQNKAWEIIGGLLEGGKIEAVHDQKTGEMKLCEMGKVYEILSLDQKRKRERRNLKKSKPNKENSPQKRKKINQF